MGKRRVDLEVQILTKGARLSHYEESHIMKIVCETVSGAINVYLLDKEVVEVSAIIRPAESEDKNQVVSVECPQGMDVASQKAKSESLGGM